MEEPLGDGLLGIWPDNVASVDVFMRMSTQWRYSPVGDVLGLHYEALPMVMRRVPRARRSQVFDDVQLMELHALSVMRKG